MGSGTHVWPEIEEFLAAITALAAKGAYHAV